MDLFSARVKKISQLYLSEKQFYVNWDTPLRKNNICIKYKFEHIWTLVLFWQMILHFYVLASMSFSCLNWFLQYTMAIYKYFIKQWLVYRWPYNFMPWCGCRSELEIILQCIDRLDFLSSRLHFIIARRKEDLIWARSGCSYGGRKNSKCFN